MENADLAGLAGRDPTGASLTEAFLAERGLLRKVVAGMGLRGADAEDVLQTVSVKCLSETCTFADQRQRRRWLIRVTTNECITEHRRRSRRGRRISTVAECRSSAEAGCPLEDAVSSEQLEAVQEALHDLDDGLLRPLVLRYFGDLTSAEIGEILSIPAPTVRCLLHRGRMALAKALMKRGIER
jgi:RNA polymerase sigma factor (sigma-70 family)